MMYLLLLLIVFSACDAEMTEAEVVEIVEATITEAEPEIIPEIIVEAEPAWTPEKLTLYIFDSFGEIVYQETTTAETYSMRYNMYRLAVELNNRDYPKNQWTFIGGGT